MKQIVIMNLVNKYILNLLMGMHFLSIIKKLNLKVLLNQADKNMYECKTRMKQAKQNLKK